MARKVLFLLLLCFCLLNLGETLGRSGIPFSIQGKVQRVEMRREMEPGVDDVYLLWMENRVLQIDPELAGRLWEGERISKRAWRGSLQTPHGRIRLTPSQDFQGMLVAMPWLLACGWLFLRSTSNASPTTKREPLTTTKLSGPASPPAR